MLSFTNISLKNNYGSVFERLSLTVLANSCLLIRGPNGSGKSCLLKMILGKIVSNGTISWNGINILEDINAFNQNTIYVAHTNAQKTDLTVRENLKFWCKLYGNRELFDSAVSYFELTNYLDIDLKFVSSGIKRRVELARLLLNANASLWLLDEPEANLDSRSKYLLTELIRIKCENKGVVIMASHSDYALQCASTLNLLDFQNEKHVAFS